MTERKPQRLFGINVFTWQSWDEGGDYGDIILYNVEFPFESMKKFNGRTLGFFNDGKLEIYSEDGTKIDWEGYAIDIPEFFELVKSYKK
jgi:hypothetical protein